MRTFIFRGLLFLAIALLLTAAVFFYLQSQVIPVVPESPQRNTADLAQAVKEALPTSHQTEVDEIQANPSQAPATDRYVAKYSQKRYT